MESKKKDCDHEFELLDGTEEYIDPVSKEWVKKETKFAVCKKCKMTYWH